MKLQKNDYRGTGLHLDGADRPLSTDVAEVRALLQRCPEARETPLIDARALAAAHDLGALHVKDERNRMGLGSFKALGAAFVIARDAAQGHAMAERVYVTASAGNHGLSVAMGARVFGAQAVIYIAETVPEAFAERLRGLGARVIREGTIYEEGMAAAQKAAAEQGWELLSDSSWPGYLDPPHGVMQGYLVMAAEAAEAITAPPTHIFLQAGVGGMAAAAAAYARNVWGDTPIITVVEPEAAPALINSIRAGAVTASAGPVSTMGRLDCKEPSLLALAGLSRDADFFLTIDDDAVARTIAGLGAYGLGTSPSGGAGLAAALDPALDRDAIGLGPDARILTYLSEGAVDE